MKYLAFIVGGIGPDVWDKEVAVDGADFRDAALLANGQAEEMGGRVLLMEEWDSNWKPGDTFKKFARTMIEKQHISERLMKSRLACYDENISQGHDAEIAYDAANRVIHVQ